MRTQDRDHGRSGLAAVITHIWQAEPQRDDTRGEIAVVAPLVAPLLVDGMCRVSVDLHAHGIVLVEVVEIPAAGALPDSRLPHGGRKPVRAFHPPYIAVLKHRQGAITGITERRRDFLAPAHFLARLHS